MREKNVMLLHYLSGVGILIFGGIHLFTVFFTRPLGETVWETTLLFEGHQFAILEVYRNMLLASSLWFLLLFTTFHGLNGLRVILIELFPNRAVRSATRYVLLFLGFALMVYGTRTIVIAHMIR
ncbi:MAG: hypothetical protein NZ988_03680 [Thaumarchaeota archaeon]|nr:hypothetical protein [Candidatus Calditenuaceae archaeon]MDW8187131.1 hypothetical protein [Nitrososphaerota archaeon]